MPRISDSMGVEEPRICISNNFHGNANAIGLGTSFWGPLAQRVLSVPDPISQKISYQMSRNRKLGIPIAFLGVPRGSMEILPAFEANSNHPWYVKVASEKCCSPWFYQGRNDKFANGDKKGVGCLFGSWEKCWCYQEFLPFSTTDSDHHILCAVHSPVVGRCWSCRASAFEHGGWHMARIQKV